MYGAGDYPCVFVQICVHTHGRLNMCVHMGLEAEVHVVYLLRFPYTLFFVAESLTLPVAH